jgi:YegS/Rv2252/BmrU family lipid kinase
MDNRQHLFVINPSAGLSGSAERAVALIRARCEEQRLRYEMVFTERPGHAQKLVHEHTDKENEWLVYACGGDGTLNEVVCGAVFRPNIAVTHIPFGTGNDFIRVFEDTARFLRMETIGGYDLIDIDIIKAGERFCVNTFCMGFDARSADKMTLYRWAKRISPKIPYGLGVATALFGGLSRHFAVEADGEKLEGDYTLLAVMNGRYYGGGFNPTPRAMPNDGFLDMVIVDKVGLLKFSKSIGKYAKGEVEKLGDIMTMRRVKRISIKTVKPIPAAYDGEMEKTSSVSVQVLPGKLKFAVPKGVKIQNQ